MPFWPVCDWRSFAPRQQRESFSHPAYIAPITFAAGILTGLLSAGAKVFQVPLINKALGHDPKTAYALAALGVSISAPSALGIQFALGHFMEADQILLALYLFALIVGVAMVANQFWTARLSQWVSWIVSPILVLVGIRFVIAAVS